MIVLNRIPVASQCSFRKFNQDELHITRTIKEYVMIFMLDRDLYFCEDGEEIQVTKGNWFIQEAGKEQSAKRSSPEAYYFYLHFRLGESEPTFMEVAREGSFSIKEETNYFKKMDELSHRTGVQSLEYQVMFLTLLKKIMLLSQKEADPKISLVNEVIGAIEEHYIKEDLKTYLEGRFHLSYHYLYKLTKKFKDISPMAYGRQLRIQRAKELLSHTNEPIEKIGYGVGFKDPSVFYKAFKKEVGMPPRQWRQESRR